MMNTTMNRQEHETFPADVSSVVLSLQLHNLILRPNLKPKITSHSQNRPSPYHSYLNSPLSVDDLVRISSRPSPTGSSICPKYHRYDNAEERNPCRERTVLIRRQKRKRSEQDDCSYSK